MLNNVDVDNEMLVGTPLAMVGDPALDNGLAWMADFNDKPKMTSEELVVLANSCDPFALVDDDIRALAGGIKHLLGSDHPVLESCAKYFFEQEKGGGKSVRPTMVLAISYALNMGGTGTGGEDISNKHNGNKISEGVVAEASASGTFSDGKPSPRQKRLAEIVELIHTASLFHDDVIDKAGTRRGVPSVNQIFGNKLAILGGDFLLSRASVNLARLRNHEVTEIIATVIEHLVKGEILQMKPTGAPSGNSALMKYMKKNFYKTASLMGNGCLAAAVLGNHSEVEQRAAYLYGTYLGQAFQLVDDVLDFEDSSAITGKTPLADLHSGLATAPTLFASEEFPKLTDLISRKFELPGDVEDALSYVKQSNGLQRSRDLAQVHAEKAIEAIKVLQPSPARDALVALACKVVIRKN
jgi:geranylgeranyl pyrophosphate synthase